MTEERVRKIKNVFEKFAPIVKTSMLRENKICSRDIAELMALGHVIK